MLGGRPVSINVTFKTLLLGVALFFFTWAVISGVGMVVIIISITCFSTSGLLHGCLRPLANPQIDRAWQPLTKILRSVFIGE